MSVHNPVSAPSHYTVYPVQPIEITRHLGFCLGNAVKYVLRAPYKGGEEDCRKATQYLEWEFQRPGPLPSYTATVQARDAIERLGDYIVRAESDVEAQVSVFVMQGEFLSHLDEYLLCDSDEEKIRIMARMSGDVYSLREAIRALEAGKKG